MDLVATVVVPILNESLYIEDFLRSLEGQTINRKKVELFLVDGQSEDNTVSILEKRLPSLSWQAEIINNPKRSQASAMNLGIQRSRAKYIIRLDAHSVYEPHYIETCIRLLEETGVSNVGFYLETKGKSPTGQLIAKVMSSKFGVGNSSFRTQEKVSEAETVPFGAFRRDKLVEIGGFNEALLSNEDNDINYRIRQTGGRILLSNESYATYYTRDNIKDLINMALRNGKWNIITLYYIRGAMRIRHFIPFVFTSSLILLFLMGWIFPAWSIFKWGLCLEGLLYLLCATYFSKQLSKTFAQQIRIIGLFFIFHFFYGLGSIRGCLDYLRLRLRGDKS